MRCGLGATRMLPLPSQSSESTVVYGLCGFCGQFWQVGAGLFEFPALLDDEVEELYPFLFDELTQFDFTTGASMFKKKTSGTDPNADLELALCDPFRGLKEGGDTTDPTTAPSGWSKLSPDSADRAGLALLEGDPPVIPAGIPMLGPARRLRARSLRGGDGADGSAVSEALAPYFIDDPVERKRWQKAAAEVQAAGPLLLTHASWKLKEGGDLADHAARAAVRARRTDHAPGAPARPGGHRNRWNTRMSAQQQERQREG